MIYCHSIHLWHFQIKYNQIEGFVGLSRPTLQKAEDIVNTAEQEIIIEKLEKRELKL